MKSEKDIENEIRAIMEAAGCLVWKNYTGPIISGHGRKSKNANAGQPDLFGVLPGGVFVAIEVKKPGARTDPARLEKQIDWIRSLQRQGARAIITDNPEDVRPLVR